jgi:hypothetical protein
MSAATRVLVLEDDAQRIAEFRARFQELERASGTRQLVRFVRHVGEAINELTARDYEVLLLDHDLNGTSGTDSAEVDTGAALVRWLAGGGAVAADCRIIIHSLNARGARRMADDLGRAGISAECYPRLWKSSVFREAFESEFDPPDDSSLDD